MSRLQVLLWERPPVVLSSAERSTVLTTTDCLQQFCVTNYECIYRDLDGEDRFTVVLLSKVVSHVGDDHSPGDGAGAAPEPKTLPVE